MLFVKIIVLAILILIFVQDVRNRSVYWFLFPVLVVLFVIVHSLQHHLFAENWQAVLVNIGFLVVQYLIVSVYFSIKSKQWVNITDNLLGWGDILFLLCITVYLSALNFLLFYVTSLIISLLIWLIWQLISKKKNKQIPLAGLQALIFTVFLAVDWWFRSFDLTNDTWLLSLIMK